ncbi:MAG: CPBP family glutamic-type intramembrane protease [Patescibacteria group bacterium]
MLFDFMPDPRPPAPQFFNSANPLALLLFFPLAFFEEIVFRYLPLGIAISIFQKQKLGALLRISAISSISFGLAHGFYLESLYLQGVAGFIYSLFFIKCASGNPRSHQIPPLLVTTVAHAFHNISAHLILM